jgi:hypothetical protein
LAVVALVATTVLLLSAGPAHAGCDVGPGDGDARVRKGNGDYRGAGIYNCDGMNQSVFKGLDPGERYTAGVKVKNDSNGPTDITMAASSDGIDTDDFKIKFLKRNGNDVSEKVFGGDLVYQDVAEGASTPRLDIVLKARSTAQAPGNINVLVHGGSSPVANDTVAAAASLTE